MVGAEKLDIDYKSLSLSTNGHVVREGDWIALDGGEGIGYTEALPLAVPQLPKSYETFMKWADKTRRLRVRTNADTPQDARKAREFGRVKALDWLLPFQRRDFIGIFKAMEGSPVTIRLIDPPLHEFVPHDRKKQEELANELASTWTCWRVASSNSAKPTRCQATADAVFRSLTLKSLKCRCAPSSRRPSNAKKPELKFYLRSCTG